MDQSKSTKFVSSLSDFIHFLCSKYVEFEKSSCLTGQLCLSVDRREKIEIIIEEDICLRESHNLFSNNSKTYLNLHDRSQPISNYPILKSTVVHAPPKECLQKNSKEDEMENRNIPFTDNTHCMSSVLEDNLSQNNKRNNSEHIQNNISTCQNTSHDRQFQSSFNHLIEDQLNSVKQTDTVDPEIQDHDMCHCSPQPSTSRGEQEEPKVAPVIGEVDIPFPVKEEIEDILNVKVETGFMFNPSDSEGSSCDDLSVSQNCDTIASTSYVKELSQIEGNDGSDCLFCCSNI